MQVDTFRWLRTDAGQALVATAASALTEHRGDPVAAASAVRRQHSDADQASAALSIAQTRAKAVEKFGDDAARMYFTPEALEQSTRARVAAHRAARLAAAEVPSVVDLGCSIGGDLIAMSRAGLVVAGVDQDPLRVEMAQANLEALGLGGATQVADATQLDISPFGAAFVDPARRTQRGRSFRVDDWQPSWEFVTDLIQQRTAHAAVAKVAPGIPHDRIPDDVEAEWVSEGGELKEAVLWSPLLASARRRATIIAPTGLATLTQDDDPYDTPPVGEVAQFLYEPDPAAIRAHLVTAVAAGVRGHLLDEHIAYVTSAESFQTPFARGYRVLEELPYRTKQLKAALRERNVGTLTIKKRGVEVVPEQLRKQLDLAGDQEATIVMTRVRGEGTTLLVESF